MKSKPRAANAGFKNQVLQASIPRPSSIPSESPNDARRPILREYQREAVEAVLAGLDRGERGGLVSLPTGAGKTVVAARVLASVPGRALVVAHTSVLVCQLREALEAYLREPVGLVLDGSIELADARIVVASRQSLTVKRLAAIAAAQAFEVLVFDEAHHAAEDSMYSRLLDALRACNPWLFVLGLTATPWRESGRMLFERWLFSREIADLVPLGVLAPVRYETIELPLNLRGVRLSGRGDQDYNPKTLEPSLLAVGEQTAQRIAPLVRSLGHVVVFAVTVKHAHALAQVLESLDITAAPIWGAMKHRDRDEVLQRWRDSAIQALVNVGIVTEGFDEPRISAIVFARPTASTLFYIQALGRGLRTAPGKRECLVVDCVGLGDLPDARQCTLDAIVPEVAALSSGLSGPSRNAGRRLVSKPDDDAVRIWLPIAQDAYVMRVDKDERYFIVRGSNGLWHATIIASRRIFENLEPAPFPVVVEALSARLRGKKLVFAKRAAPWRKEPATKLQYRTLSRLDRSLATRAQREGWSRGRVSNAISVFEARYEAYRLGILRRRKAIA